ncbi:MAG: D-alanyl-D-alanine carboxypeptidase family protein [Proteobacteria bacterium]|nr:D-alanyl-D-alanine carboxypeptidase family protein [Pseudomonadota bacterium]NDD03353.1 D-alanyl-D-alanine carboxypeptidase family protein [Pseudomonadota bacterium]
MSLLEEILTGRTDSHTEVFSGGHRVHQKVVQPLTKLKNAAAKAGFDLAICSGFRSFDRQLMIWNEKVSGKRPVPDSQGRGVNVSEQPPQVLIDLILRWSALPGASRHHWGTDFDVIDQSRLQPGQNFQLIPQEFEKGALFGDLHEWLDTNMDVFGFFRPYESDRGGVSPERWHLSYAPLASDYLSKHTLGQLTKALNTSSMLLKKEVLLQLPEIWKRFVINTDPPRI